MWLDYDPIKYVANQRKHGIALNAAVHFEWETAQVREDTRFDYEEQRFEATGYIAQKLYVLIFCIDGETTRAISLRRAEKYEEKRYAST